jgi:hypothetical protein
MGVTIKDYGALVRDRNVARIIIDTSSDNQDDWIIGIEWQDAFYDEAGVRQNRPELAETTVIAWKDVRTQALPEPVSALTIGDMLAPIRAVAYAMRLQAKPLVPNVPPAPKMP